MPFNCNVNHFALITSISANSTLFNMQGIRYSTCQWDPDSLFPAVMVTLWPPCGPHNVPQRALSRAQAARSKRVSCRPGPAYKCACLVGPGAAATPCRSGPANGQTGLRVAYIIKWIDSALACGMWHATRHNCRLGEGAEACYFMQALDGICTQQMYGGGGRCWLWRSWMGREDPIPGRVGRVSHSVFCTLGQRSPLSS